MDSNTIMDGDSSDATNAAPEQASLNVAIGGGDGPSSSENPQHLPPAPRYSTNHPPPAPKPSLSPNISPMFEGRSYYSDDSFIGSADANPIPPHLAQPNLGSPMGYSKKRYIVKLDDVLKVNPLESEAETLIMMAIEKQDATIHNVNNRSRANTGNSSLLEHIPAASIGVFSSQTSPKPGEQNADTADDESHSTAAQRVRLGSVDSRAKSRAKKQLKNLPKPQIKRNQTMEQTLASLTVAMAGFQDLQRDENLPYHGVDATVHSAAEAFAQNANIVFRGKMKSMRDVGQGDVVSSEMPIEGCGNANGATKNWGKLRSAIKEPALSEIRGAPGSVDDHKKTDAGDDRDVTSNDADVEVGVFPNGVDDPCASGIGHGVRKGPGRKNHLRSSMAMPNGTVQDFQLFVGQRRGSFLGYVRFLLLVFIPATGAAFILFYISGTLRRWHSILVHYSRSPCNPRDSHTLASMLQATLRRVNLTRPSLKTGIWRTTATKAPRQRRGGSSFFAYVLFVFPTGPKFPIANILSPLQSRSVKF